MQLKKRLLIVIGLILLISIGGKMYMDNQKVKEQEAEEEKIEAERMSVGALKRTFADIKSVEFEKTGYNKKTGSYRMFVKITNQKNESVNFSYSFWKAEENIGSYVLMDEKIQKDGITSNKVKVIYSNQKEDEV